MCRFTSENDDDSNKPHTFSSYSDACENNKSKINFKFLI